MVVQGLLLVALGMAASADTGGRWGTMAATGGEGRRLEHSRCISSWCTDNWCTDNRQ